MIGHASRSVQLLTSGGALLLSSAALFVTSAAHAIVAPAPCEPACVKGFHCETQTLSACPDIACAPDSTCPPMDCKAYVSSQCVADPCTADTDCAEGMVCATETSGCSNEPADPGGANTSPAPCPPDDPNCKPPADLLPPMDPPQCDPITVRMCKPKYELPCKVAADCGAGFECVEEKSCWCSGSSGQPTPPTPSDVPPSDEKRAPAAGGASGGGTAGSAGVAPPADCGCTPTGTYRCELKVQTCNFNSDCPAGLLCKPVPTRGDDTISGGGADVAPPSAGGAASMGGSAGAQIPAPEPGPTPQPPVTELFCVPPYFDLGSSGHDDKGEGTVGVGGTAGTGGTTSFPSPDPSLGARSGSETPPTSPNDADATGGSSNGGSKTEGGCQVGAGTSSQSGFALLTVLGLAGLIRRRSRRVA